MTDGALTPDGVLTTDGVLMTDVISRVDALLAEWEDELLTTLCELIAIDSQIPPFADERAIIADLRARCEAFGLADEVTVLGPAPERPSMLVRHRGAGGGPALMLNGHVDTKPVGEARALWRSDPHHATRRGDDIVGLGANDMKSGVAAMLFAARAVRAAGVRLRGDLVLGFVADEEDGANEGSRYIAPLIEDVDAVLIGEPSGWEEDWQRIHLVSRGVCCFRIIVTGTQMHSSLSDRMRSVNASVKAAGLMHRMPDALRLTHRPHPLGDVGPTLNVGVMISGGTYFGVVPGHAEFACDVRTVPGMSQQSVAADLDAWLAAERAADPDLQVRFEFDETLAWIPYSEMEPDHPLAAATARAAADVLGEAPEFGVFPGGTDAPWYSQAGIPALPSFGPGMLTSAHGPNEFVSVRSVLEAARIYARIIVDFCGIADEKEGPLS